MITLDQVQNIFRAATNAGLVFCLENTNYEPLKDPEDVFQVANRVLVMPVEFAEHRAFGAFLCQTARLYGDVDCFMDVGTSRMLGGERTYLMGSFRAFDPGNEDLAELHAMMLKRGQHWLNNTYKAREIVEQVFDAGTELGYGFEIPSHRWEHMNTYVGMSRVARSLSGFVDILTYLSSNRLDRIWVTYGTDCVYSIRPRKIEELKTFVVSEHSSTRYSRIQTLDHLRTYFNDKLEERRLVARKAAFLQMDLEP